MAGSAQDDLITATWAAVDSAELRLLLAEVIGGPGQYDGKSRTRLHLPLAGDRCRVTLDFKRGRIARITRGPAFEPSEWKRICAEVETDLLAGKPLIGREIAFASYRVKGSWRGERSGLQILPPPEGAPLPDVESAEHPFVLEFPLLESSRWQITNHRRLRDHWRLSALLNVLLKGRVCVQPRRANHFWAYVRHESGEPSCQWVQELYFAKIGAVQDTISPPAQEAIAAIEPNDYYSILGLDGLALSVPANLDEMIARYQSLTPPRREQFDRAAYWIDMASRQWNVSMSLSFAALVAAIEALTLRGETHRLFCRDCGKSISHDAPGATQQFRDFLERHAPGKSRKRQRDEMYGLRSDILHGSNLMKLDHDLSHGMDPPSWNERELHSDLWSLAQTAVRTWLESSATH
jgi:hypothetical protein